jgi:acetate kinase
VNVLVVNAGSSSVRLTSFRSQNRQDLHLEQEAVPEQALAQLGKPDLCAHRVVHGGEKLTAPTRIDAAVEDEIARLAPLAPLHNPAALHWIKVAREVFGVPQVAVFDTAFFAQLPAAAATYALPRELCAQWGIRRFGFHGLAHQAMWRAWCKLRPELPDGGRVITLQLGSGCSAAAIDRGRPLDTSMGFSPLEGLMMATRAGDLDPGLLLQLGAQMNLEPILNHQSGLAGLAGHGGDMRAILAANDDASRLAIDVYCHRVRKYIGAYLAVLGGADGIVFGGGVGEHASLIRERITSGFDWAGKLDVRVVAVDEAEVIREEALRAK